MKFIAVLIIIFIDCLYGTNLNAQDYPDETSKKLWSKYSKCKADLNKKAMVVFEEKSAVCLKKNPQFGQEKCDEIAEDEVYEWKESQEFIDMCQLYMPTTYTPKNDEHGVSYVGAIGGTMATIDGEYKTAIKIFEECIAVEDLDCYFKLGQMKLYGIGVEKDSKNAIKLLKYAAERGHEGATLLVEGVPDFEQWVGYGYVREELIKNGWEPVVLPGSDVCVAGDMRCTNRPEMNSCSGFGNMPCVFIWKKDNYFLKVCTGGTEGEAKFDSLEISKDLKSLGLDN